MRFFLHLSVCILLCLPILAAAPEAAAPGVVLDEIAPGSEIDKAGLQTGDVLRSWERLPSPPANPEPAQGVLLSPFDWMWLEVEQAHRGPVVLRGERKGKERAWRVAAGEWNVHFNSERRGRSRARPILSPQEAAFYEQAQTRIRRGKLTEGTASWQRLAEQIPSQKSDPLRCWLFLRIGEVWAESGDWKQAHKAFQEAYRWAQSDRTRVFLLEALGKSLEYQSKFSDAAESYRAALAIRRTTEPGDLGLARSLHQIGSQQWSLGNLEAGKEGFDQALALRTREAPGSFQEADSLHSQGLMATERSDLESAEHFLKRSVAIQERINPNSFWMAFKLEPLGDVYALRGDLEVAAHHYERVLEIRRRLGLDGESEAMALIRLGRVKINQGNRQEGRRLLEKALAILHRVFPRHPMVAAVLNDLGDMALAGGELGPAGSFYRQALDLFAIVTPGRPWTAQSWNGLAGVEAQRGNLKGALVNYQKALAVYQRVGSGTDGEAHTLANLGRIAWRTGDLEKASSRLHEAIRALEAQVGKLGGSEDVKADFRSLRRRVYFDAAAVELELGRNAQAFNLQESARAQGFLSLLAARDLSVSDDGIPPKLEEERRRVGRQFRQVLASLNPLSPPPQQDSVEKAWRELPILRERLDSIQQEISKLSPRPTSLHFPKPLPASEIASKLDTGMKILAYQVGETTTQVFVLSEDGRVEALRLPEGSSQIERKLERFRAAVDNRHSGNDLSTLNPLRQLYRSVVKPVEPLLEGADRLLILPDGPLHAVPWAALIREPAIQASPTGRNWQFFVEWKPFTVALSATVWAELKQTRGKLSYESKEKQIPFETRALPMAAFGDPVFQPAPFNSEPSIAEARLEGARHRGLDLSPLPFSRREVEGILQLFPGQVAAFLGSAATEEQAKSLPLGTRIVHFATHGFADERLPMNSGLVLTIPNRADEHAEDGFLQAWEIFERVRLNADLVVLSACDSGMGKDLGGEGLLSLTRAFQFAGARAVVASLWQVPDEGSADLMIRFYRHLKNGANTADALREAQVELITQISWNRDSQQEKHDTSLSKDLVWAAFEVFGDWK